MELVFYFFIGLIGLSLVVFIHEMGHFLAARFFHVEVEAFAVGFGKPLWRWKPGKTEYRLCLFPLGGYCKMKGEEFLLKSLEKPQEEIQPEPDSLFAVHPLKRLVISAAGPLFNLLFAFVIFFALGLTGTEQTSVPARIVLSSELNGKVPAVLAAEKAGLRTGDLVEKIDGKPILNYSEMVESLSLVPAKTRIFEVSRDGQKLTIPVSPQWVESDQRYYIGVLPWIDPLVKAVQPQSSAAIGGLKSGDRLTGINGQPLRNKTDLDKVLNPKIGSITLQYLRDGKSEETRIIPDLVQGKVVLGLEFAMTQYPAHPAPFPDALEKSLDRTASILGATVNGLVQLVTGKLNLQDNLSGPLRTSQLIGEVTSTSFEASFGQGVASAGQILSFISIGLFLMNLLPIPALDGGSIVLSLAETFRRKRVRVQTFMRYQQIGFVFLILLIVFVTFNDILHFIPK